MNYHKLLKDAYNDPKEKRALKAELKAAKDIAKTTETASRLKEFDKAARKRLFYRILLYFMWC